MVRKTTKNIKRVQETTAEVISRLSDYLGSDQVIDEVTGGLNMAPKKRKVASKRKRSPSPDGEADTPARETRPGSRRVQFSAENEDADDDFERQLQRELEEPLSPDEEIAPSLRPIVCYAAPDKERNHPLRTIACYAVPDEESNPPLRTIGCGLPAPNEGTSRRGPPSLFEDPQGPEFSRAAYTQPPWSHRARGPTDVFNPTPEECVDWYMDAALKEVKGVLRLANENKLRQADLWNLLTFGQHMFAGMKQYYDIDLNKALLRREKKNMGTAHLEPEHRSLELPWPTQPPRRCPACSRVVAADEERTTWKHPWNRSSFTRLFPQEDRYDAGGMFGSSSSNSAIATDPYNIPRRMGTTYAGWR